MRYMFMIYLDPDQMPPPDTPELLAEWDRYDAFTRETGERELFETADALQPPDTGTTVRVRNDETIVTRRAVRRDERAARRLLRVALRGHGRGARAGIEDPCGPLRRDQGTPRSSSMACHAIRIFSRPRAQAAADEGGACGDQRDFQGRERARHRGTRASPPRPRRRRGGRSGRLPRSAPHMAEQRHSAESRGLDHDGRSATRHRPDPTRHDIRDTTYATRLEVLASEETVSHDAQSGVGHRNDDDGSLPGRATRADLCVLPSGAQY